MKDTDYDMDIEIRTLPDGRCEATSRGVRVIASSAARARFMLAEVARRDHTLPAGETAITLQRRS